MNAIVRARELTEVRALFGAMNVAEALKNAVRLDTHCTRIGPKHKDYADTRYKADKYLRYAELLEDERNWKTRFQFSK